MICHQTKAITPTLAPVCVCLLVCVHQNVNGESGALGREEKIGGWGERGREMGEERKQKRLERGRDVLICDICGHFPNLYFFF